MKSLNSSQKTSFFRRPLALAVSTACGLVGATTIAMPTQAQVEIEEVLVTATRRSESVQDIPMSVSVLGETQLEDLNITDMEDYIMMLPNVSFVTLGPSSGDIYIRGISSGGESSLGANPSVAVYLDEQPVTAVGQYLNPHVYDVNRIEVLAGPSGNDLWRKRSVGCHPYHHQPARVQKASRVGSASAWSSPRVATSVT
jgi:outer membrane receptor protein involved in Fe transport